MNATRKRTTKKSSQAASYAGFTEAERDAMKEHAKELKRSGGTEDREAEVLAKIAQMSDSDRAMAERIHAIITENVPELSPKTWYGMPAYAGEDGKVVCFFQSADKFKSRYSTFGFNDSAKLDHGAMWPTAFALTKLTSTAEKQLIALVKKAVS